MLRSLLRSHPNLTIPTESHFIPRFYKAYGDPPTEFEARRLARRILSLHWVKLWDLELTSDHFASCRSYSQMVSLLFGAWARREGKPRWGDKTPLNLTEMPTLLQIFPEAKIIHIVRDGRDVALSWLQTGYHPRNLYFAARLWNRWVGQAFHTGQELPAVNYLLVQYESLLGSPSKTMRNICKFIDEPYTEDVTMLTPTPIEQLLPARQVSYREIVTSNAAKWRTRMSRSDRVCFESVAGDLLEAFGYELEGLARRVTRRERVYWSMHQRLFDALNEIRGLKQPGLLPTRLRLHWAGLLTRFRSVPVPQRRSEHKAD